jgi:hypothetical protein
MAPCNGCTWSASRPMLPSGTLTRGFGRNCKASNCATSVATISRTCAVNFALP